MCYILSTTSHVWVGHKGGDSAPCTLCRPQQGGHRRGGSTPCRGPRQRLGKIFFGCVDPPMVFCMVLHMVFGYDGFRPLVFCSSGQGNYGYVLILG